MRTERGFTLLEVMVATAVMAVAIAGVISALNTSLRNASRLTDYDRAAMLARRQMDLMLSERKLPRLVWLEGAYDPGMTNGRASGWRARITPWEFRPGSAADSSALERIELEVWWLDGNQRRQYALESYRRGQITKGDVEAGVVQRK